MSLFKKKTKPTKTSAAESGERVQLTVLFYDIVGSTGLGAAGDPETLRMALGQIHDAARDVVQSNGGSLEQVMGDGGMAYFGFPTVREDSAIMAVKSALDILQARDDIEAAPNLRVGVATSVVVVPDKPDALADGQLGAVGVAPNLAARLEAAANPNTALVSPSTHELTRRAVAFEQVDGLDLKGFPDVTRGWRATRLHDAQTLFERDRDTAAALTGREDEAGILSDAWRHAVNGFGRSVLIEGEPGIGKSHLVSHLAQEAAEARVVTIQAMPRTEGDALFSIIQMYEAAYEAGVDAPLMSAAEQTAERLEDLEDDETLGADARRNAIVSMVAETLAGLAADKPLLLIAEDLHWADEVTLAVLEHLAYASRTKRILVAATTRPEGGSDLLREDSTVIALRQIDPAHAHALVDFTARQDLPQEVRNWIIEKADGNPLFLIELTHHASDLQTGDGSLQNLKGADVGSLRDLLATRLDRAGRAKRVAQIASVLGRSYPYHLLSRVAKDVDRAELDSDLQRLLDHGLKEAQHNGYAYSFRHALIRDVAYDSQLRPVRKALHGQIVDLVDADPELAGDVPDILLAEHCLAAERTERGLSLLLSIAEDAIRRSAIDAPRKMLERVLDGAETLATGAERDLMQLKAISLLGPLVTLRDGHRAAAPLYERGHTLYFALPVADRAPFFAVLWGWWFTATDLREQARRGEALIRDVPQNADSESRLQALHCGWATLFDGGAHSKCLNAIEDGLALFDTASAELARYHYGHDARVCGLGERALCLWFTGQLDGSAEAITACERWADETAHLSSQLHGLDIAMQLAVFNQDMDEIDRILSKISDLSGAGAAPVVIAKRKIFESWMASRRGQKGQTGHVEEGLAALREFGVLEDMPFYADIATEVAHRDGDHDKALALITEEIAQSLDTGLTYWLAELYRRKSTLLGNAEAFEALEAGLSVAVEQGAHHLVLRNVATRLAEGVVVSLAAKGAALIAVDQVSDCPLRAKISDALAD